MDESPKSSGPPPIDFVISRPGDDTPTHQAYAFYALTAAQTSELPMQKYPSRISHSFNRITGRKTLQIAPLVVLTRPQNRHLQRDLPTVTILRSRTPWLHPLLFTQSLQRQPPPWPAFLLQGTNIGSPYTRKQVPRRSPHPIWRIDPWKFKLRTSLGSHLSAVVSAAVAAALSQLHLASCYSAKNQPSTSFLYVYCYYLLLLSHTAQLHPNSQTKLLLFNKLALLLFSVLSLRPPPPSRTRYPLPLCHFPLYYYYYYYYYYYEEYPSHGSFLEWSQP